jgi:hypothetical protein
MSQEEKRARSALEAAGLTGAGLLDMLTSRVGALQIDDQRAFIARIAALLSPSVLGTAPLKDPPARPTHLKKKLFGSIRGQRKSTRLHKLRNSFSSSRRSQADICKQLGLINSIDDFNDDTLMSYINLFKAPIPEANIAKLVKIAGVDSPSQLRLPAEELQALLEELP